MIGLTPLTSQTFGETKMAYDFYAEVSNRIASQLENGTVPWVKPWASLPGSGIPCNAVSNRPYSGGNIIVIWMAMRAEWTLPRFLTFNQAKAAGGHVRKGEKGITVFFMAKTKLAKDRGDESKKEFLLIKTYTVFNVAQCDNLPENIRNGKANELQDYINSCNRVEEAESFIEETGATIGFGGDRACYIPSIDAIQMPEYKTFKNADNYYATMFHELGHWTGDKKRLDRDLTGRFKTEAYAAEELVAELTSAFLCAEFSFDGDIRHASYIAGWIKLLKEDKRAFFTAASKASAAAEYLRGLAMEEELAEAA